MPSKDRDQWRDQIHRMDVPDFEHDNVKDTIASLLAERMNYLAKMVDGIFTGLSGEHVTNRPEAFGKRMIITDVHNIHYHNHNAGLIHDMRRVIAKFMGREGGSLRSSHKLIDQISKQRGVWQSVDGGSFRMRIYKNGNAHLEVHPDISYRLNMILAHIHPMAIPRPHRTRPNKAKPNKNFSLIQTPISFAVLNELNDAKVKEREICFGNTRSWDKHLRQAVLAIMEALGGVKHSSFNDFTFDYDVSGVFGELLVNGVIPDSKSYQFYPTPEALAAKVVSMADIKPDDRILEPSAGQGGIARFLPSCNTTCIEISPVHADVLKAKGFNVEKADFLTWNDGYYDKIVMNPPYSEGRALAHLEHAAGMLNDNGTLIAILPEGIKSRGNILGDFSVAWSEIQENAFDGTSINTIIATIRRSN